MNILTLEPSMAFLCWEGVWASLVSLLFVLVLRVFWGIFFTPWSSYTTYPCGEFLQKRCHIDFIIVPNSVFLTFSCPLSLSLFLCSWK